MQLHFWFSRAFLGGPFMLWSLLIINLLGTIYGYIWYGDQLIATLANYPLWVIPFVPDSPTASLFFTLSVAYLLIDRAAGRRVPDYGLRGFIEAFGAVTSVKYGVWAVTMIFAAGAQGSPIDPLDWMLVVSHLGMAAEAILYVRFFRFRTIPFLGVVVWTLANDWMDYHGYRIHPWLQEVLRDDLGAVEAFTVALTLASAGLVYFLRRKSV